MRHKLLAITFAAIAAPAAALTLPGPGGIVANMPALLPPAINLSGGGNLVTNGSFETGDFTGWDQVGDTSFTFVTDVVVAGGPTDGTFHAAFGPVDPSGGFIIQTLATIPGQTCIFSFDLANLGGTPNAFGAIWDDVFVLVTGDLPGFDYGSFSGEFVASGASTVIGFGFYHDPSFFLIDNISVAVIPEPGTWAMLIAGFGLVGFAARRRRTAIAA